MLRYIDKEKLARFYGRATLEQLRYETSASGDVTGVLARPLDCSIRAGLLPAN